MEKKKNKLLFISASFICMIYIITAILGERYLYSDGANYFLNMSASGRVSVYPLGRATCDKLMQCFAVAGIYCGIRSLKTVGGLFALGCTFWPSFSFLLSVEICMRHKRRDLMYLIFIIDSMILFFYGFFCQLESVIGVTNYLCLLLLCLLHDNTKTYQGKVEFIYMTAASLACYHLNEYYCVWSFILAFALLSRIVEKENRLGKSWLGLVLWHLFCAYTSYRSISARGEVPVLWESLVAIINRKIFILLVGILILIIVISLENFKVPLMVKRIAESVFFAGTVYYVLTRAGAIARMGYDIRFALFGGGGIIGILFFILCRSHNRIMVGNMEILCMLITIFVSSYLVISGIQFRQFNTAYYELCTDENRKGFIRVEENTIKESFYYIDWICPYQSVAIQGVRGNKKIHTIINGSDSFINQYVIEAYPNLERYGIYYEKAF